MEQIRYAIYDIKDNELCCGIFETRKEIAKYFNTTSNYIGTALCRGNLIARRYRIEKIEKEVD